MSEEVMAKVHRKKLLRCSRNGYTWKRKIFVDADKKKGVEVHASLCPKIKDVDGNETTKLHITANVRSKQLMRLRVCSKKCWLLVNTDIMDRRAGKSLYNIEGALYPINVDDGQVNFNQVLVPHEKVSADTCEYVTLVIKVIFVVAPNSFNLKDDREEDGFTLIEEN
jgi:hypothetical protein